MIGNGWQMHWASLSLRGLRRKGVVISNIAYPWWCPWFPLLQNAPRTEAAPPWLPLSLVRHVRFCQVLDCLTSLDEHARKFLTASAPTDQPDLAPAFVQQGLQSVLLKRQRPNPSRLVKNFCQGRVRGKTILDSHST